MLTFWAVSLLFFSSFNSICYSYYHNTSAHYLLFLQYTKLFSSFNVAIINATSLFCFNSYFNKREKKAIKKSPEKVSSWCKIVIILICPGPSWCIKCVSFNTCILKLSMIILINIFSNLVLSGWTANKFSWLLNLSPNSMNMNFKRCFSQVSKGQGCSFRWQCVEQKEPCLCLLSGLQSTLTSDFSYY